jgi:hypothetical protein
VVKRDIEQKCPGLGCTMARMMDTCVAHGTMEPSARGLTMGVILPGRFAGVLTYMARGMAVGDWHAQALQRGFAERT